MNELVFEDVLKDQLLNNTEQGGPSRNFRGMGLSDDEEYNSEKTVFSSVVLLLEWMDVF